MVAVECVRSVLMGHDSGHGGAVLTMMLLQSITIIAARRYLGSYRAENDVLAGQEVQAVWMLV